MACGCAAVQCTGGKWQGVALAQVMASAATIPDGDGAPVQVSWR